jgi:hypothetical protein
MTDPDTTDLVARAKEHDGYRVESTTIPLGHGPQGQGGEEYWLVGFGDGPWIKIEHEEVAAVLSDAIEDRAQLVAEVERLQRLVAYEQGQAERWMARENSASAALAAIYGDDVREAMDQSGATTIPDLVRGCVGAVDHALRQREELRAENTRLRENPSDGYHTFAELYRERAALTALVARLWIAEGGAAGVYRDDRPDMAGWQTVLAIGLPSGQVSWHFSDADAAEFLAGLPPFTEPYDGHTTPEKYARVEETARTFKDGLP